MSDKVTREIERFQAKSPQGTLYTIIVYQDFIISHAMNRPDEEIPTLKHATTPQGWHVNYIDDNTYLIVETRVQVTRINA